MTEEKCEHNLLEAINVIEVDLRCQECGTIVGIEKASYKYEG